MRQSVQTDRENPADPLHQEKQEALEKLGLAPPSHHRLNSLISQLRFPDVGWRDGPAGTDFLIKLPPELLTTSGDLSTCAKKGFPPAVWLYNQLNVEESGWCSVKRDGPLCHIHANVGPGLKSSYIGSKGVSSAPGTGKTGWHLHAFAPSAHPAALSASHIHTSAQTHSLTCSARSNPCVCGGSRPSPPPALTDTDRGSRPRRSEQVSACERRNHEKSLDARLSPPLTVSRCPSSSLTGECLCLPVTSVDGEPLLHQEKGKGAD